MHLPHTTPKWIRMENLLKVYFSQENLKTRGMLSILAPKEIN